MSGTKITTATIDDVGILTPLFDAYRVFYRQPSDLDRARAFLTKRLQSGESVIFVARHDDDAAGFVQMFPSFSSVSTGRIWILNDLYVAEAKRRLGIARSLLDHAASWARERGSLRLILETAKDNHPAKALYEEAGWRLDSDFDRYSIDVQPD